MKYNFAIFPILISACACSHNAASDDDMQQGQLVEETQTVSTTVANKSTFYKEVVSNGRAMANQYADVYWEVDGTIENVCCTNGVYINAGTPIAKLAAFRLSNTLESAKASLENSRLQMYETLIGQGYSPDSIESIPQKVIELAQVKSGYLQAEATYKSAEYDMQHSTAVAPIGGIVANMAARPSNKADRSRPLCRIIDTKSMQIEFSVIESELELIRVGNTVDIEAFSMPDKRWTGRITEINPYVESNGMVSVRASIDNGGNIFEGMNLSVKVRQEAGEFVAVPKGAVVLRSNRPVVFVAQNGKAQWVYVETAIENSDKIAITSGINEGDSVIVGGNEFLAHNSNIVVKN